MKYSFLEDSDVCVALEPSIVAPQVTINEASFYVKVLFLWLRELLKDVRVNPSIRRIHHISNGQVTQFIAHWYCSTFPFPSYILL